MDPDGVSSGRRLRRASAVAFTGDEVVLGAADGSVRVLDPDSLEVKRTLDSGPRPCRTCRRSTTGRWSRGTIRTRPDRPRQRRAQLERFGVRTMRQPDGRRTPRRDLLRRSVRASGGAPTQQRSGRQAARRENGNTGSFGSLRRGPTSSASATTSRSCPVGDSTDPARSLTSPPRLGPLWFNSTGDLLFLEQGKPRRGRLRGSWSTSMTDRFRHVRRHVRHWLGRPRRDVRHHVGRPPQPGVRLCRPRRWAANRGTRVGRVPAERTMEITTFASTPATTRCSFATTTTVWPGSTRLHRTTERRPDRRPRLVGDRSHRRSDPQRYDRVV